LRDALSALGGEHPALPRQDDAVVFDGLSQRFDSGHAVVLRGLLDSQEPPSAKPMAELGQALETRFTALANELRDKFAAIERDIPERFGVAIMGKRLQEAGWFKQVVTGWETTGKGSRKDLRAVFLLVYRELVNECERILVQCQSRCDHLDDLASRQWLASPMGNGERIPACLAEGLRPTESERLKAWRNAAPKAGEDAFCLALAGKWEKLLAADLASLHLAAARPWADAREDGFQGYARRYLALCRAIAEAMVWLSRSRWQLHLRGLPSDPITENRP
jgi:hypothetical protein